MKKLKYVGLWAAFTMIIACNVSKDTPQAVQSAFAKKFPNATSVSWGIENPEEWEAEFKVDGVQYSANFFNDGRWKETEHEIEKDEIPQHIMSALMEKYPDAKIRESEISQTAETWIYEFEIKDSSGTIEVGIDKNGIIDEDNSPGDGDSGTPD